MDAWFCIHQLGRERSSDASRMRSARPYGGLHSCTMAGMLANKLKPPAFCGALGGVGVVSLCCACMWRPLSSGEEPGEGPQSSWLSESLFSRLAEHTLCLTCAQHSTLWSSCTSSSWILEDFPTHPSCPSSLIHWSSYLFLCQYHAVFIVMAL
jgi:hypothetical protein